MQHINENSVRGYVIAETIGFGPTSVVHSAVEPGGQQQVALKIILGSYARSADFIRRFDVENRLVKRLDHPQLVPLYDFWREPDGAYLVMQRLPDNLGSKLKRGTITLAEAARIVQQIASVLTVAHDDGMVHRNLKPSNILLSEHGAALLTDFGIMAHDSPVDARLYQAPEQMTGSPETVTYHADIYSLGLIVYEGLTGVSIAGDHARHGAALPPVEEANPSLPASLNAVLQQATAASPLERHATIADFANAFDEALSATDEAESTLDAAHQAADSALSHFIRSSGGIRWRFERAVENPYRGLKPFDEADANHFYGRDALTRRLLDRLAEDGPAAGFLAVVGPSGSGKSSVVRAGLIASLRRGALPGSDRWFIATMTPRSDPLEQLRMALLGIATHGDVDIAAALKQDANGLSAVVQSILTPDDRLLLFIDQFEELFTLAEDEQQVQHFLALLMQAVHAPGGRVRIVITLRADFYDRPLMQPGFSALISERTEAVPMMTPTELEQAIVGPLARVGARISPELVPIIVDDVKLQPGALPMLQYALTTLFDQRDQHQLTLDAYQAIGGVSGALTRQADAVFATLGVEQQAAARQLFLRLVTLGEGTEDTRRQALRAELVSLDDAHMPVVIDRFGQARLLTFDHEPVSRAPTVEVAHEAIIRSWVTLRSWLDESRADLRQQRILASATREWLAANRDTSFLASGSRLEGLAGWVKETNLALSQDEESYIQASLEERNRQRSAEQARGERERLLERRARQRAQFATLILAISVVVALMLAALAWRQEGRAQQARDRSDELALLSNAQVALYRTQDTDQALALALEAVEMGHLPDDEYRVLTETMYAPGTRRLIVGPGSHLYHLDLSADGTQVVVGDEGGVIHLWDVATGSTVRQFNGHTGYVRDVVFSPDERRIASVGSDGTLYLWDVNTGDTLLEALSPAPLVSVSFTPDGQQIATGADDGTISLYNAESGELLNTLPGDDPDTDAIEGHRSWVWGLDMHPTEPLMLSAGRGGLVFLWDLETLEPRYIIELSNQMYDAIFSADGSRFLTAGFDLNDTRLWDTASGEPLVPLRGHTASVYNIAFGPDETTALSASQDNTLRLWDLETGAELHRFVGHSDYAFDLAFLPGGERFISSSWDGTLRVWDIVTNETLRRLDGHENTIYQVQFDPAGERIISASRDQTARIWDVASGEQRLVLGPDDPATDTIEGHADRVISAAFSPDGERVLTGDLSSNLILWDAATGEPLQTYGPDNPETDVIEGHTLSSSQDDLLSLWYVTFGVDGRTAFSTAFDQSILRWDLETGEVLQQYLGHENGVLGVRLIDDGQRFLSWSWDATIILWDTQTGEIIRRYAGHSNWIWSVALHPDGEHFLSTSADNSMILWHIDREQPVRTYLGHEDAVLSAAFSPDGHWIISSGRDKRVTLWNVETGAWLRHFNGHSNWIRSVDYHPSQNLFVTGDNDGSILLWQRKTLPELVMWAHENRYVRALSCEERQAFHLPPYCDS